MKQVEEEYYKIDQAHSHGSTGGQGQEQLVPPTPAKASIKSSAILPFGDLGEKSPMIVNDESEDTTKLSIGPTTADAPKGEATVRKKHPFSTQSTS